MSDKPRLLVVDDEQVICQACRRVFARQGIEVDETTDAREGLRRAVEGDYAGILLDIKMPEMDGIQFLEEMRRQKPDAPVMIMTGYPSIPNAAAAVRLGASDYITKPFSPEQITQSVRRLLSRCGAKPEEPSGVEAPTVESGAAQDEQFLFFGESWLQAEEDGSACVGAVPAFPQGARAEAVRFPQVGEVVYQGLPLAGVTMADGASVTVPSPVSGVIVSVNEALSSDPSLLVADPCGKGWIACICTTRLEQEIDRCKPRCVILANANELSARSQREKLEALGCRVHVTGDRNQPAQVVENTDYDVLVFDAASFGEEGPELVGRINAAAPSLKVVVAATSEWEAEYRKRRIFYYAIEPFVDNEIVEILNAAFRAQPEPIKAPPRRVLAEPLSGIRVVNHNAHKVHLLAVPGLLWRHQGLGRLILRSMAEQSMPITTIPGDHDVTPASVLKAAGTCDRVMVLLAKDVGRLPGSLARDTKAEYVSASRENAARVTTLVMQPDPSGMFAGFDDRTTAALARHIVDEMASY
jgi:CheY-like chemotaxis protein